MKKLKLFTSILLITSLASCDALDDLLNEDEEVEEFEEDSDAVDTNEKKEDTKEEVKEETKEEPKKDSEPEKEEQGQTYTATFYSAPEVVFAKVTKQVGYSVNFLDLGKTDDPVKASDKEGYSYIFSGWNRIENGQVGTKSYSFDSSSGIFSDNQSSEDVSYMAYFVENRDVYYCDFCSYTGEKLFDMRVLYNQKPSESTQYTGGYSKYYEPSYTEDGKNFAFVGWSTTKGDSASNSKSLSDLPAIKKKETYYAIYNRNSYTDVFIELTGEESGGKYKAWSFNEAKTNQYVKVEGNKLTQVNDMLFAEDSLYGRYKPYNLYLSNNSITTIGSESLKLVSSSIRKLSISSITTIEENGFKQFNEDTSTSIRPDPLDIPIVGTNVTTLSSGAFRDSGRIGEFTFPKISTLPTYCFEGSQIRYAKIPDNMTKVDQHAFKDCKSLEKIHIGKNVSNIVFKNGSTTTPNHQSPFYGSPYVEELTVDSTNTTYKAVNNALIRKSDNTLIYATLGTTTIPDGVTNIESGAFYSYDRLYDQTITIPTSVTSIKKFAFCGTRVAKINYLGTKQKFQKICETNIFALRTITHLNSIRLDCSDEKNLVLKDVISLSTVSSY